jgi:hypothetical protein
LFGGICDQFSQANRRSTASSAYPGRVTTHLAAFALASAGGDALRLATAVRAAPPLMQALRAARDVGAPDWLVCAGAIRDAVWDALHDRPPTALPRDVDLGFFDSRDLSAERDEAVEAALRARAPALPWEAKNQAAVHLWYPERFGLAVAPFRSCAEAVATFPETRGVRRRAAPGRRRHARRRAARPRRPPRLRLPPQPRARPARPVRAAGGGEGLARALAADALRRVGRLALER